MVTATLNLNGATASVASAVEEATRKFSAARTSLVLDQFLLGTLAMGLKLKADYSAPTAWTDGRTLGFNPDFILSLPRVNLVALVGHEILHVALGHPWRRGNRDQMIWNIATDKVINVLLRDCGFVLPPDGIYAQGIEIGKSAEWIADHMPKPPKPPEPPDPPKGDEPGDGPVGDFPVPVDDPVCHDGQGKDKGKGKDDGKGKGDGKGQGADQNQGQGGNAPKPKQTPNYGEGEVRDAPTGVDEDGDPAPTEAEWQERVAQIKAQSDSQGMGSASLDRAVEDALEPRIDPRALLLQWMQEKDASNYTWKRPNYRYLANDVYLPSLHNHRMGKVAIMVDTSGSIDDVALQVARGITQSVLEEVNPREVIIVFADDRVQRIVRWEQGETLKWEPKGGGGTSFIPALKAIDDEDDQPVATIAITDLYGSFPEKAPEVPVIWLSTNSPWKQAPYGDTIFVGQR